MSLDANNMVMPVSPMYGGYGNNGMFGNGFGGDGWWVLLFLLAMGNGFWGNNGRANNSGNDGLMPYFLNSQTQNDVNRGFDNSGISSQIAAVQSSVNDINTGNQLQGILSAVNNGFSSAEVSNCNRAFNQMQGMYQTQISDMNARFSMATDLGNRIDGLSQSLANCCCENRLANCQTNNNITAQAAENRFQSAQNTRDIIENTNRIGQEIKDKLCQIELDTVKNELSAERRNNQQLNTQLQMANLAASQAAQTATLQADNAAQTQYIVNRVAPYPIPSYTVGNPYYGVNNNCGCGCGNNF